jgi:hypothetical protein
MARKLYYKVSNDGKNLITNQEWEAILRLQHWYNSEFIWTAGKLCYSMYIVFPNTEYANENVGNLQDTIHRRQKELKAKGLSDNEAIKKLEMEGLIITQKGGYFENCIASGFTRVAGNEFNAYLVCEFLLKASLLAPNAIIAAYDEGSFIKSKDIRFQKGEIILQLHDKARSIYYEEMINNHHVFAIVDPAKYDAYPRFKTMILDFNELDLDERLSIVRDWNWLGFENNYDRDGDDIQGFDLNKKVINFQLEL